MAKFADKADDFAELWRMLSGLPPLEREYKFASDIGRKFRFDFADIRSQVAVEIDGNAWHTLGGGRHGSDADREKMNLAASLGWRVFHFSPKMLNDDPAGCVEIVKKAIIGE